MRTNFSFTHAVHRYVWSAGYVAGTGHSVVSRTDVSLLTGTQPLVGSLAFIRSAGKMPVREQILPVSPRGKDLSLTDSCNSHKPSISSA